MKRTARFGCFMFWSASVVTIGLTYLHLNSAVPLFRLIDIISISFFFALFLITLDALFDAKNKPMAGVFLFIFVAVLCVPSMLNRQYPRILFQQAEWLFLSFCVIASLPIIIDSVIHGKTKDDDVGAFTWMLIINWSAVLGISFWISLFKGVWLSISEIGVSFLAVCVGIIASLMVFALISLLFEVAGKIASMHHKGFLKHCSK